MHIFVICFWKIWRRFKILFRLFFSLIPSHLIEILFFSLALVKTLYQKHFQGLRKFQTGDLNYALVSLGWKWPLHVFFNKDIGNGEGKEGVESLAVISLLHIGFHIKEFMMLCALWSITAFIFHCFFPYQFLQYAKCRRDKVHAESCRISSFSSFC